MPADVCASCTDAGQRHTDNTANRLQQCAFRDVAKGVERVRTDVGERAASAVVLPLLAIITPNTNYSSIKPSLSIERKG